MNNFSNYYNDYYYMDRNNQNDVMYTVDERGFLVPFILGGITGGLLAPAFYPRPYYPRPCLGPYCNNGFYPTPYPYY